MSGTPLLTQELRHRTGRAAYAALVGLVLIASLGWFLAGIRGMALVDRDEPMIAEVARQMVHRGEWLTPHLPAWEEKSIFKPPLAMWLMAVSFKTFGVNEFAARLPSAVCAAFTATLCAAWAARRWGGSAGFVAATCMTVSLLPAVVGHMAVTDSLLTLLATVILFCLERSLRGEGGLACKGTLWAAAGAAMLIKGPAILAFLGPALVLAADGFRWRRYAIFVGGIVLLVLAGKMGLSQRQAPAVALGAAGGLAIGCCMLGWLMPLLRLPVGPVWGLPVMLAVCGWWFAYVSTTGTTHQEAARRFLLFEVLTRIAQPMESHWGPPGYYLAVLAGGLLPFTAAIVPMAQWSWRQRRRWNEPLERGGMWDRRRGTRDRTSQARAASGTGAKTPTLSTGIVVPPLPAESGTSWRVTQEERRENAAHLTRSLLWAWAIGSWLLCEVASTKLPHYILPAMPAVALLAAMWWRRGDDLDTPISGKRALGLVLPVLLFAAVIGSVACIAWQAGWRIWLTDLLLDRQPGIAARVAYLARLEPWQVHSLLAAPMVLLAAAAGALLLARRQGLRPGLAVLAGGWTPALLILLMTFLTPSPFNESLSRQAARQAVAMGSESMRYFAVGYTEPAVFFYLPAGRYTRVVSAGRMAELAEMEEPFVLICSRKLERAVRERFGPRIDREEIVFGLNTAKGNPETACVLRIVPSP